MPITEISTARHDTGGLLVHVADGSRPDLDELVPVAEGAPVPTRLLIIAHRKIQLALAQTGQS